MKFKFLKKAAAFVTAAAMSLSMVIVLPEEALPFLGFVANAESSSSNNNRLSLGGDGYSSAYITENGDLYTWGHNNVGQLGDGTTNDRYIPEKIMSNVSQVSFREYYSACITTNGDLYTWGANDYGVLGIGYIPGYHSATPQKIAENVSQVSLGVWHIAYITTNGDLYTWGNNEYGQLGDGTKNNRYTPQKIMSNVSQISLGDYHSACITTNGDLYTWGSCRRGVLGDDAESDRDTPVKIMSGVSQVSLGGLHSACVTENGDLYTWGANWWGQLGDDINISERNMPVKIMSNVSQVSLGDSNSACITTNGDLYTWGNDAYGKLGDGNNENKYTPVKIMSNVSQVSLGVCHGACITTNGDLYTWGRNNYGQLGNGTTTDSNIPIKIEFDSSGGTEETEPIEIDVQFLDEDKNPIDTIEYKRGKFNLDSIKIQIINNTNTSFADYYVKCTNKAFISVDGQSDMFPIFNHYQEFFESNLKTYEFNFDVGEVQSIDYYGTPIEFNVSIMNSESTCIATVSKTLNVNGDVFSVHNGEYDVSPLDYDLLVDNLFVDNFSLRVMYYFNKNTCCNGGTCYGFSTVLSCLRNNQNIETYFPNTKISELKSDTIFGNVTFKELIQIMQYTQYIVDIKNIEEKNKYELSELAGLLTLRFSTEPDMFPIVIHMMKNDGKEGHAVAPYKIEKLGSARYRIYIYDSNFPYDNNYFDINTATHEWNYRNYNNTNGYLSYINWSFNDYMKCIQNKGSSKIKINSSSDGTDYSSMIITDDDFRIVSSGNDDVILNPIGTVNSNPQSTESDSATAYYVLPDEYTISSNNNSAYNLIYCLSDTAISADLPANAEITLKLSDITPEDTYATVSGSSGDSISLSLEHDTLINRDFTDIKFDGVMYDTLKIQETDDGMTVSGLKSGSFEITASDGTVTTRTVDDVPESATITAIVYSNNTGDVLIDDSANSTLSKISVDGEELSDFASSETEYAVTLPYGTTAIPTVTATPANANSDVDIAQATSLTGTEAERTATITVTAEDGVTKTIYKVVFSIETHTHNLATEYSSDETGHWYECSDCDEKVDFEAHTEDSGTVTTEPTETTEGVKTFKCTQCDYVIRTEPIAVLDHTHTLATEYSSDATGHWFACFGCDEKIGFEAHTEDSGTITTEPTETTEGVKTYKCTKCRYVLRTEAVPVISDDHTHNYEDDWKYDSNSHWHECACGDKTDIASHTSDGGTITLVPSENSEGIITYKCNECDCILRMETIPAITPEHTCSYGTNWKYDSTSHWHECSCGNKSDISRHISNSGIVTVQPTATTTGLKTYSCSVCGYTMRTEILPATGNNSENNYPTYPGYPTYPDYPTYPTNPTYTVSTTPSPNIFTEKLTVNSQTKSDTITLKWDEIKGADKYLVYYYKDGKYVKVKTTEDTSVTFRKLKNGKTYKFRVRYTINGKLSPISYSCEYTVTVYYKPIAKATATQNSVRLSWKKVPGAEKYAVYKYVDGKAVKLCETKKLAVKIKKLKSNKEYKYIVRAYVNGKWTTMTKSDIVTVTTE